MKTHSLTALATILALAAGPVLAETETFSGLDVKVDLSDYQNSNALVYWPDLEHDLMLAIMEHSNIDKEADVPKISVTVNNVAVDGDTVLPDSGEFNQLTGTVQVFRGNGAMSVGASSQSSPDDLLRNYFIKVTAVTGDVAVPDGWVLVPPSQDKFYTAMVDAFAMEVVDRYDN
ncbi:MAG: hypothetical protein R3D85_06385 [Paracoccaceae bacterium]